MQTRSEPEMSNSQLLMDRMKERLESLMVSLNDCKDFNTLQELEKGSTAKSLFLSMAEQ